MRKILFLMGIALTACSADVYKTIETTNEESMYTTNSFHGKIVLSLST